MIRIVLLSFFLLTTAASAASWDKADALYDARGAHYRSGNTLEEQAANARAGIAMYKELLATETNTFRRIYAGGQIAGLYYYITDYLMPMDRSVRLDGKNRKDWADECFDFMDVIAPEKVGPNQPYYLGKVMCLALSAQLAGILEQLGNMKYFEEGSPDDLIYTGMDVGYEFQGGGLLRTIANVRADPLAVAVGAGDLDEALWAAKTALAIEESSEFDRFGNTGPSWCDNWLTLAEVQVARQERVAARNTILDALDLFWVEGGAQDFEILAPVPGLEIDTLICVERMFQLAEDTGLGI